MRILKLLHTKAHVTVIIGIIIVSLFEMRILTFIHAQSLPKMAIISDNVLQGTVYNPAFQNRLLGPLAVRAVRTLRPLSAPQGYFYFLMLMLALTNVSSFFLFYRLSGDVKVSLRYLLCLILFFILLQDNSYFYPWDAIGLLLFTLFSFGIFARKPVSFFVILFAAAIFNKEDALFIPLWLIIDAFAWEGKKRFPLQVQDYRKLGVGTLLLLAGAGFVKYMRAQLGTVLPESGRFGNQFELFVSFRRLFYENIFNLNIIITFLVLSVVVFFFVNRKRMSRHAAKITVLVSVMYIATITFGVVAETRIWFALVPFILMFHMHFEQLMRGPGGWTNPDI